MFIRETTKTDKKTGKIYASYQLVEAYRTPSGPRQKIILTVNSEINLSSSERKDLANRIEEILSGAFSLISYPEHIESLAQHFSQLLLQKNSLVQPIEEESEHAVDYQRIDINNIRHTSVKSIGCEYIALSAYRELGFDEIFSRLNFSSKQKFIAASSIIGRAVHPSSERALYGYLKNRSALDTLLKSSFSKVSLDHLYFISDDLYDSKKAIEKHLRERERSLFNLQETIILYDITNTYFEGACKSHKKAKRGKSKEKRSDCPLLAIGVVLDAEGFPKHSEIFEGNVNERATLQEMLIRLNKHEMKVQPIIVMDSGIATKDNVDWLKAEGFSYIVMMKRKDRPSIEQCKDVVIRDEGNQFISASLVFDKETNDHLLWCYSKERLKKEQDIKDHKKNALEKALNSIKEGLDKPRKLKTVAKVHQKIGRLREKYARLAQHCEITIHPSEDGINVHDITWVFDSTKVEKSFSGTYTLRTNVKDLSAEKIWEIYVMLSEAESCFRCLKSEMGLRPNWHHRHERIDGHIFISLLAYHLIATIRKKLKGYGIDESWETIREKLQNHALVATTLKTKKSTIYLRQASDPDAYQRSVYTALGLSFKPIRSEKTVIKTEDVVSKN